MPKNLEDVDTDDAILLVPTAHVSEKSAGRVERTIQKTDPDVVAVELDEERLERFEDGEGVPSVSLDSLLTSDATPTGALLTALHRGMIATILNKRELTYEDTDMFTGVHTAREQDIDLALIDRPFREMRRDVVVESDLDELTAMIAVLGVQNVAARFASNELADESEATFDFDPDAYNSVPKKLLREAGANVFETPRDIILEERNEYMVDNINDLSEDNDTIVVVIGGAHLEGMRRLLHEQNDKDILTVVPEPEED